MSKKSIVDEIIRVYDENQRLKWEIEKLKGNQRTKSQSTNEFAVEINELALENLFGEVCRKTYLPKIRVGDNNNFNFLTYEQWSKEIGRDCFYSYQYYNKLLQAASLNDILETFEKPLKNLYTNLYNEAKMEDVREGKNEKNI